MPVWLSRCFLAAGAAVGVLYYAVDAAVASLLTLHAVSLATLAALLVGLRLHRPADRRPWLLLIGSLTLWQATGALALYDVVVSGPGSLTGNAADPLALAGNVLMLAAAVVLVLGGSGGDTGGVLDATVFSIAGGTLIWELALYPRLSGLGAHPSVLGLTLVQLLCVMGVLGAVLRLAAMSAPSRPTLTFFGVALVVSLVGNVGYTLTSDGSDYTERSWADATVILAYACLGAAALHPSMARLGEGRRVANDVLHDGRLAALATALLAAPLVVGVSQLLGREADTMLLAVASISTVPLVMIRIRRLVQERHEAERELEHQATHDALTGLANRVALLARLQAAHARVRDGDSPGLCLLFCDLNGFKAVNDTFGHGAGDELLVAVAHRLTASVRATDVVARFGGDEFVVLCEGAAPAVVTGEVYPRIAAALREPVRLTGAGASAAVAVSVGLATCGPDDSIDVADLLRMADGAMYAAKRTSRGLRAGSALQVATA